MCGGTEPGSYLLQSDARVFCFEELEPSVLEINLLRAQYEVMLQYDLSSLYIS